MKISAFFLKKRTYTHARTLPPAVCFCSLFNDPLPHSLPQRMYFLNDPLDHDVPSALVLNLDQTPLSYVSPGKYTFSSKGSKNVPVKGLDDKKQITVTFVFSATGSFLPIQLIYQGKSKKMLAKIHIFLQFSCHIYLKSLV